MAKRKITEATRRARRKYNATPKAKKRRAENNRARRKAIREGKAKKGDGKDVHHTKGNNGKPGPTKVVNRSWNRKRNYSGGRKKR